RNWLSWISPGLLIHSWRPIVCPKSKEAQSINLCAPSCPLWLISCLVAEDLFLLRFDFGFTVAVSRGNRRQGHEAFLRLGLFQDVLAIEGLHARIFRGLFEFFVAGAEFFVAGSLGDAEVVQGMVALGMNVLFVQAQLVGAFRQTHSLTAGKDLMAAMLVIPLGECGRHVHLFDDVAPAHAGVVGAEADLAFLRGVRNNALLGAAEVIVVEILEPHAGHEEEVPAVGAASLEVFDGPLSEAFSSLFIDLLVAA